MSTIASVNTVVVVVKDVVVDVTVTEAEGRSTGVKVEPVVVGVRNSDSNILSTVAVGVADEGSLPVSVKLAVGHGDASASMGDVKKTIVAKIAIQ